MLYWRTGKPEGCLATGYGKSISSCLTSKKEPDECENDFERWIYLLKHMDTLERMPFKAKKGGLR